MTTLTTGEAKIRWVKDVIENDDGARIIVLVGNGGDGKSFTVDRVRQASAAAREVPRYIYAERACNGQRDPRGWDDVASGRTIIVEVLTLDWEKTLKEHLRDDASVRVGFFA